MTVYEALDLVNKSYIPGVVGFYAKQDPDPWQTAHDDLEHIIQIHDDSLKSAACELFVNRCHELIARFKKEGLARKGVSIVDALALGDEARFKHWDSIKRKHCVRCERSENLTLVSDSKDPAMVFIVCRSCEESVSVGA